VQIIKYCDVSSNDWNRLCEASDEAWFFHRYEWLDIEADYFAKANHSFGILADDGCLIGIHPLYLRDVALGTWCENLLDSGFHRHTGLALVNGLPVNDVKASQRLAMQHIFTLADSLGAQRIQLNANNAAPKNLSAEREEIPFWVRDYGFHLGLCFNQIGGIVPSPGLTTCHADQIIKLGGSDEEELFGNLSQACRRAIRKARRSNLEIVVSTEYAMVDTYYTLAEISAQRTGENLAPKDYYQLLLQCFAPHGNVAMLFVLHEGMTTGALLLVRYKSVVSYMGGISHHDYLPLRINDFMHWSAISRARLEGYLYYKLGPVFPELPLQWPISKVSRFKGKWGAQSIPIIQGSFFLINIEKYIADAKVQLDALVEAWREKSAFAQL